MKEFVGEQQDNDSSSLMWEYLNQDQYDYQKPERGEIRQGVVLRKEPNEIVLDIGVKLDAVVPASDLSKLDPEEIEEIAVGDELAVYILNPEDTDGRVLASINMAKSQEDWIEAERMLESGEIFEAEINGHNKGGLIAPFGRLRGFIPASQVMGLVQRTESGSRLERLEQMVGRNLKLKVIEVNQKRRRLILSERAAMREWRAENKQRLLDELQAGDVREGVVTNLMNFGAFVDLGGADGLVHVSELAWHRVKHPKDVLEIGQEVEVYVLSVDIEKERIALSMKRLQADPWSRVDDKYSVGDVVEGEVTNLTDFGAFARIESGIEGLIHISELADYKIEHPREIVHRGQRLTLRIISIDTERQRIGLSLKRAPQPEPTEEEYEDYVDAYGDDEEDEEEEVAVADAQPQPQPTQPESAGTILAAVEGALGIDDDDDDEDEPQPTAESPVEEAGEEQSVAETPVEPEPADADADEDDSDEDDYDDYDAYGDADDEDDDDSDEDDSDDYDDYDAYGDDDDDESDEDDSDDEDDDESDEDDSDDEDEDDDDDESDEDDSDEDDDESDEDDSDEDDYDDYDAYGDDDDSDEDDSDDDDDDEDDD